MRRFLFVFGISFLLGAPAIAADIPVKAQPAPVAPIFTWTGYYFGAGGGWSKQEFNWAFNPAIGGGAHQAYTFHRDGWNVGLYMGYQHQFGQFVLGWESGVILFGRDYAREPGFGNNSTLDSQARIRSLLISGPRVGWAVIPRGLLYASGGFAAGEIESRAINVTTGVSAFGGKEAHYGWYAGGGAEYAITDYLIVGAEYLHVDLRTELHCPNTPCLGAGGAFVDRNMSGTVDIVRARLTFKSSP